MVQKDGERLFHEVTPGVFHFVDTRKMATMIYHFIYFIQRILKKGEEVVIKVEEDKEKFITAESSLSQAHYKQ